MREYGSRVLFFCYFGFACYGVNKYFLNPPEYTSQEAEEKGNIRFGLYDVWSRFKGYISAYRETTDNKVEIKELNVPGEKKS